MSFSIFCENHFTIFILESVFGLKLVKIWLISSTLNDSYIDCYSLLPTIHDTIDVKFIAKFNHKNGDPTRKKNEAANAKILWEKCWGATKSTASGHEESLSYS